MTARVPTAHILGVFATNISCGASWTHSGVNVSQAYRPRDVMSGSFVPDYLWSEPPIRSQLERHLHGGCEQALGRVEREWLQPPLRKAYEGRTAHGREGAVVQS
jgi:hypothetical protein